MRALRCRVDAGIHVSRADVSHRFVERVLRALSVPNPAFLKLRRLGKATHRVPEYLCFVEERDGELRIPRGAVDVVRSLAAEEGMALSFEDGRTAPALELEVLPPPSLRGYQQEAVDRLLTRTQGTFILPVGAGKTRTAIAAIARLRTPTLILVGSRDLAAQWRQQVEELLGVQAGRIGGVAMAAAPITIATVQSFGHRDQDQVDTFLARFGAVILDEAHAIGGRTFHQLLDRCPAKYRLGLTATPVREDGLTPLLGFFFGPSLAEICHEELVQAGVLLRAQVRRLETGFDYPYTGATDFGPMLDALVRDGARNAIIGEAVATEVAAGEVCLVLTGRKDHCQILVEGLAVRGVDAAVLTSDVPKSRRSELLDATRAGRMPVLVATSLADEGLDIPRLSRLILAFPGKAKARTIQRLGRILRPHADKRDAVLIDVVDVEVPVLRRHAAARRRAYEAVLGPLAAPGLREVA